jgi:Flp pilus assembly protein TadB
LTLPPTRFAILIVVVIAAAGLTVAALAAGPGLGAGALAAVVLATLLVRLVIWKGDSGRRGKGSHDDT